MRAATETLIVLHANFPLCFARLDHRYRAPLKLKIHFDLIAGLPQVDPINIRRALTLYAGDARYLRHCVENAVRIDLTGVPAGIVTAAEATHAKIKLGKIERKHKPKPSRTPAQKLTLAALKDAAAQRKLAGASS
jgi:ProP effector